MEFLDNILRRKKNSSSLPDGRLQSCQCTQAQLQSDVFQAWRERMHEPVRMHRKLWEFCYVTQALHERGMLAPGRRGLGFAVGKEPLPSLFASLGCEIVATDLETEEAQQAGWVETNQHADSLEALNCRGICDSELFSKKVSFRYLDMRCLPDDLGTFDFIWSCCSFEHLGTIALGEQFIYSSLKYLKPGGVSVHTTEFNLSSNIFTRTKGPTVIYRKRDLQRIAANLRRQGCKIELDFTGGNLPYDRVIDRRPYKEDFHLKLRLGRRNATSFGLIIER